jgi:hypothetical protein
VNKLAFLLAVLWGLAACPPAVVPPGPDASDAAAAPDAGSTCATACTTMTALCGPQSTLCVTSMTEIETRRLIRSPSGAPVTCACVAAASSLAALKACGVACGP